MVVVYKGSLYAISDNLGVHYLYYYANRESGEWMIGTSLYEMAKVAPFTCHVDDFNLIEECYAHSVYGDETIFQEFFKVTGEKLCKVDLKEGLFEVLDASKPQFIVDNRTADEIAMDIAKEFTKYGESLKTFSGNGGVALCMTGGIDARLTLVALLHTGIKPTLYYGVGNSALTNTKAGDLEVDKMLASKFGLQIYLMNYKNDQKIGANWDSLVEKYGFLDHFSTVTPNLKKEFEAIKEPLQIWNFFGEMFRNVDYIEDNNKAVISIDEILKNHYVSEGCLKPMIGEKYELYRQHIYTKIQSSLNPYLDGAGDLPVEFFVVYDYYRRINCDTHKMNMCNQFRYSLAPLGDWRFLKYMTMTVNERKNARLMLKTMDILYPKVLEIPFFSHQHWREYDKDSIKLKISIVDDSKEKALMPSSLVSIISPFSKTRIWTLVRRAKPFFSFVINPIGYFKSQNARESISSSMIFDRLIKMIQDYPEFKYKFDPYKTDYLPKDAHLLLLLYSLRKLNSKIMYH